MSSFREVTVWFGRSQETGTPWEQGIVNSRGPRNVWMPSKGSNVRMTVGIQESFREEAGKRGSLKREAELEEGEGQAGQAG